MNIEALGQFFQDDSSKRFSATRLAFLAWILGTLMVWGTGSFHHKRIQKIPDSVTTLIGILMTGKVVQKFSENSSSTDSSGQQTSEDIAIPSQL